MKRRRASCKAPVQTVALCTVVGAAVTAWSGAARAQNAPGFAVNRFEPSETGSEWFANDSLDLRGDFRPAIGVVGDYSDKPYVLLNQDGSEQTAIIADQTYVHVGASVVLFSRLRLGATLPILVTQDGSLNGGTVNGQHVVGANSGGIGDLRLGADVRLIGQYGDVFTLALGGRLWAPTGDQTKYLSDNNLRIGPQLAAAGDISNFVYSASLGVVYRENNTAFLGHPTGSEATFGMAAGARVLDKKLVIGPELWGSTVIADQNTILQSRTTPLALIGGAHYTAGDWRVGLGAGPGLSPAAGTAQFRAMASVEWVPAYAEPVKRIDRDGDGVFDDEDACPDVAGVRTNDPKTNGCPPVVAALPPPPPPDRDHDGIPDSEDACPDVPGIRTDDPNTNGCPSDRDHDGIYDTVDACPDVPGIKTDDPKTNGCPPDPDRDKDGILNEVDACPDVPGPKSDDPKTSGCPRVFIKNGLIQILEQPKFDFNKAAIKKESDSLLTEVAKVMTDHPEIKKVSVEGHTDNVGSADFNKKLSQQRADAVVKWLSSHGIAADRLKSVGVGKDRPLVPNDTDLNRALNRRVEFHIEEQDETVKEVVKTPTGDVVKPAPKTP